MSLPLWWIVVAPAAAALINGILALSRRGEKIAPALSIVATLVAAHVAFYANPEKVGPSHFSLNWLTIGQFNISVGVHVDHLTWVMLLVVCTVSTLVQFYSIGYMKGEAGYARYFCYLALFTTSMLALVVADNLFQLYVCWELVGICSYLLIGFWWFKPSAANAAKKAFVVNRFGDVGFLLGVLLLSSAAGSFTFEAARVMVERMASGQATPLLVSAHTFLWLVPVLLFCGAIGKSAQFPLHVWLPDAMEGPTPVSALIHAATMVAAGVYMVARLFFIFATSGVATDVVLIIGTITALLAATIAVVQVDIKKVMAYSTVSQLGYMMMGLGAVGWVVSGTDHAVFAQGQVAAMFHLTTHAMFKALLFLTAGSVIHAMHHAADPNDLRGMGGLLKRMPITAITCGIGVLALSGIPPFAGFWSKDAILTAALEASRHNPLAMVALIVGILVAGLTAFYSMRMWMMAFAGEPRSEPAAHARESSFWMWIPLALLAIPSVVLGWLLNGSIVHLFGGVLPVEPEAPNPALMGTAIGVAVIGLLAGWRLYSKRKLARDPVESLPAPVYRALWNLWGIEGFWNAVGARGTLAVGRAIAWTDRNVVDRYVANGTGWLCGRAGAYLRKTSNGQAQSYATALIGGIVVVAALLVIYESAVSGGSSRAATVSEPAPRPQTTGIRAATVRERAPAIRMVQGGTR